MSELKPKPPFNPDRDENHCFGMVHPEDARFTPQHQNSTKKLVKKT
jgi:hypothetical protein